MSASPATALDNDQNRTTWRENDEQEMVPNNGGGLEPVNGEDHHILPAQDLENPVDYARGSSVGDASIPPKPDPPAYREKQVKPNKVYIGGLPEHTRQEDLQNCFGKLGDISAIELKVGYGFVEFASREAAELSVSKYHEGTFMGNKIRVELSRGGGRTAKYSSDPGACFRCGQVGHWARECPHHPGPPPQRRNDPPLIDRIQRDNYLPPPPAPPPRDTRYDYPPRDYRRPPSPPRDYYARPSRYEDYPRDRERERYAAPPPPVDYRGRYAEPTYRGAPPSPYAYDRYDRYSRDSKYSGYAPPPPAASIGRPRTPPKYRDDYPPPRDYDYRDRAARPVTPPRYTDYPARGPATPPERYTRRSASPPPRSAPVYDYPSSAQGGNYPSTPPHPPPRSGRDYSRTSRDDPADVYRRA